MAARRTAGAVIRSWISAAPLLRHVGRLRSPWTKGDVLTAAGVVVAITAIVVSAMQSRRGNEVSASARDEAHRANDIAASAQVLRPGLKVSAVAAYLTDDISGKVIDAGGAASPVSDLPGPKIDITVGNSRTGASLITAAILDVSHAERLDHCIEIGGGVQISMNYDFALPDPGERAVPYTLSREMRFQVDSGKHDRFTLTVGPESVVEGSPPVVAVVGVTLVHDDGMKLPAGTFAVVSTGDNINMYPTPQGGWDVLDAARMTADERACFRRNGRRVQAVLDRPGVTASKELVSLGAALRSY